VQVYSVQAGRSLSGFVLPALSDLLSEPPCASLAARWSLPAAPTCDLALRLTNSVHVRDVLLKTAGGRNRRLM